MGKPKLTKQCLCCGKIVKRGIHTYCSNQCQKDHEYISYIERWKNGEEAGFVSKNFQFSKHVRRYIFEKYDNKCSSCGWSEINPYTGRLPLEVDHVDGNPTNTTEENLILLCPNCHALTSTYRGANVGNGRATRRKQA